MLVSKFNVSAPKIETVRVLHHKKTRKNGFYHNMLVHNLKYPYYAILKVSNFILEVSYNRIKPSSHYMILSPI